MLQLTVVRRKFFVYINGVSRASKFIVATESKPGLIGRNLSRRFLLGRYGKYAARVRVVVRALE